MNHESNNNDTAFGKKGGTKGSTTKDMSQAVLDDEALSALMDNELSDFELRRLLNRLEHRPELLQIWERYNLSRAALRSESMRSPIVRFSRLEFSDKVMAAVAAEPALQQILQPSAVKVIRPSWLPSAGRVAVAASVTLAVFLGMQQVLQQEMGGVQPDITGSTSSVRTGGTQVAIDTDAQQRLNDYIRSVSIPARAESQSAPYNVLLETPLLRPVSDRELIEEIERD